MAVTVYFGTNRLVSKAGSNPEIGDDFHPNLDELRFGKVVYSGKELFKKELDAFMNKGQITLAPEKLDQQDAAKSKLGSSAIFDEIRAEMLAKGDAIIMVHGYNYTFREAAGRAAQLQQWLAAGGKDMAMLALKARTLPSPTASAFTPKAPTNMPRRSSRKWRRGPVSSQKPCGPTRTGCSACTSWK